MPDEAFQEGGIVPRLDPTDFGFTSQGTLSVYSDELSSVPTCCNDPVLSRFDPVAVLHEAGPLSFS